LGGRHRPGKNPHGRVGGDLRSRTSTIYFWGLTSQARQRWKPRIGRSLTRASPYLRRTVPPCHSVRRHLPRHWATVTGPVKNPHGRVPRSQIENEHDLFLWVDLAGKAALEPPAQVDAEAPSEPGLPALPCPEATTPKALGGRCRICQEPTRARWPRRQTENEHDLFLGVDLAGKTTLEAPVRTEPHPTCAGLHRVVVLCDVTSQNIGRPVPGLARLRTGAFRDHRPKAGTMYFWGLTRRRDNARSPGWTEPHPTGAGPHPATAASPTRPGTQKNAPMAVHIFDKRNDFL
jgi:hypothetical protein